MKRFSDYFNTDMTIADLRKAWEHSRSLDDISTIKTDSNTKKGYGNEIDFMSKNEKDKTEW